MKINMLKSITIISFIFTAFVTEAAYTGFFSISDKQIPYLAMVKGDTGRNFIVFNPAFCEEVPGPCRFFIRHVQAHRQLNHLILPPKSYPALTEATADCFAAKNSATDDVLETYELLLQPDEAARYSIPGDLKARAENIKACAVKAGNWN